MAICFFWGISGRGSSGSGSSSKLGARVKVAHLVDSVFAVRCGNLGPPLCCRCPQVVLQEMEIFQKPKDGKGNIFLVEPRGQRGIHCRFGMPGVSRVDVEMLLSVVLALFDGVLSQGRPRRATIEVWM